MRISGGKKWDTMLSVIQHSTVSPAYNHDIVMPKKYTLKRVHGSRKKHKCCVPKQLHPMLVGDFKPDVRPFTWPKRKRARKGPKIEQPELFETDFFGEPI